MPANYDYIFVVSADDNAGKSTFAEALGVELKMQVGETSEKLRWPLARIVAAIDGIKEPTDALEDIVRHKECYRAGKRALGNELCKLNPAWMIEQCIADGAKIIVGCRRPEEIQTFISTVTFRTRVLLFILYRPIGDAPIVPATEFLALQVDTKEINNCGTVENLQWVAQVLAREISK